MKSGAGDPSRLPSVLIGREAPPTDLPAVAGLERNGEPVPGIVPADFKGAVTVLNVWASWCVPCRDEAALLMGLSGDKRIRLVGINYKDQPDNARRFLGRFGNQFSASGADANGRAAIEWGVYGVPETFVVGRDGKIAYKLIGPITPDNLDKDLKPAIEKALAAPAALSPSILSWEATDPRPTVWLSMARAPRRPATHRCTSPTSAARERKR